MKSAADDLLKEFRSRPTLRAGSLIVTVFGDVVQPRGGTVWIGSLIKVLADFGVSERLVRTSIYRLMRDDWLKVDQLGRRSYYNLSPSGARKFEQATIRIYGEPRQSWSGDWCLVLLAGLDGEQKEIVRKELGWLGFAAISSSVLAHPAAEKSELALAVRQLGVQDQLVIIHGRTPGKKQDDAMRALVHKSWNLDDLDNRYEQFVSQYAPVLIALRKSRKFDGRTAFQIRTLLIQEYRRILLRDPLLPTELLPPGWHGSAAYELCRDLYQLVRRPADEYITSELETADGPLPPPLPEFFNRFGGLEN